MRRILVLVVTVSALCLALAAPAAAAAPVKQSGTVESLYSQTTTCDSSTGRQTCTDTTLYVQPVFDAQGNIDFSQIQVCLDVFTYTLTRSGRGRLLSHESGCTTTGASALTMSNTLTTTLNATSIDLSIVNCTRTACTLTYSRTVTVSASDHLVGNLFTATGRVTFTDGSCTYRQTFTDISGEIAGTLTIDGTALDESGFADKATFKVTVSCR